MKTKLAAVLVGGAMGVMALAPSASAHSYDITASCRGGLHVSLTNYNSNDHDVDVWIDNSHPVNTIYKSSFTFDQAFDQTQPHTWRVRVVAPGEKSPDLSGEVPACYEGTTTTTVAPTTTTTTVAPTTVPEATTTVPSVTTVPTTTVTTVPSAVLCVQDANGNWNFQGTNIPCSHPPTTTPPVLGPPALPATGRGSVALLVFAGILVLVGAGFIITGRRGRTR